VVCAGDAKGIFNYLTKNGVIGDWREPNVIRLSPVALYSSFVDVFYTGQLLAASVGNI
jgi:kynureninase